MTMIEFNKRHLIQQTNGQNVYDLVKLCVDKIHEEMADLSFEILNCMSPNFIVYNIIPLWV